MQNTEKKNNPVKTLIAVVFLVIFLGISLSYILFSAYSARHSMSLIAGEAQQAVGNVKNDNLNDPEIYALLKEKDWLSSRLEANSGDSISLSLNLKDSVMQIELQGVVLKKSKITNIRFSGFFDRLDATTYDYLFSKPLKTLSFDATTPKIPLMVKKAPADTIEAQLQLKKDTVKKAEPVEWRLNLEHDITLIVKGLEPDAPAVTSTQLYSRYGIKRFINGMKEISQFKAPAYKPVIYVFIPVDDARSIFRALPIEALVCIRN
jgi:hypothetical protein